MYLNQNSINVEKYLDKVWAKVGIDVEFTRHFMDRVNDAEILNLYHRWNL